MTLFFICIVAFLFALALFDLWVGVSNDAVNFLNSAIGSKTARFGTIVAVAAAVFAPQIIGIFRADDSEVIRVGTLALRWQCATFPALAPVIMTNMFLQTTRQTVPAVIVALARQGLFLIPAVLVGTFFYGLDGLILAQSVSDVCSLVLVVPLAVHGLRTMGE